MEKFETDTNLRDQAKDLASEIFHGLTDGQTDRDKINSGAELIMQFAVKVACFAARN
jgi:hypothetical protein